MILYGDHGLVSSLLPIFHGKVQTKVCLSVLYHRSVDSQLNWHLLHLEFVDREEDEKIMKEGLSWLAPPLPSPHGGLWVPL